MEKTNNGQHNTLSTIQSTTDTNYKLIYTSTTNEEITISKLKKDTDYKFYMLILTEQGYRITSTIQSLGTMKFTKGEQKEVTDNYIQQTRTCSQYIVINSIASYMDTFYSEYYRLQRAYNEIINLSQSLMLTIGVLLSVLILSESRRLKKKLEND